MLSGAQDEDDDDEDDDEEEEQGQDGAAGGGGATAPADVFRRLERTARGTRQDREEKYIFQTSL